ncbi:hypothetical protein HGP28_13200 [Vibrio sp. SM6]|uniref:Uncharacterized protein n=1 Tax=Vibrio agarilyticus TaxID=2726741 RepID=A0A7X8TS78_9VIBR|nr:hypothetical protein [Vibrio agarilyticus]NLS13848.1 hypothetical protein [Vibrio agarilyticus]
MLEYVAELEVKLGVPENFIWSLTNEDDWSFVIKLNALFEAIATQAIVVKLGCAELEDSLSYIDFGNSKFGKVTLLKKLGCITSSEAKFLQMLFELRNKLAHNISFVTFTFQSHLNSMDSNQFKSFVTAVKCDKEKIYWNCKEQPREQYVISHTKILILLTATDLLVSLHQSAQS